MIVKTTTNRSYPKPDVNNSLQDDVANIENALDMIDTDIHTLKVKVENTPPVPVLSITNWTFESVTLSWPKVFEAIYYSLDLATDSAFSSYVEGYNNKKLIETSITFTELQENTLYYCRIRSSNSLGFSEYSTVVPLKLLQLTRTFNYLGSIETWTVPETVDSITIEAWGAEGGKAGSFLGGKGAYLQGTFAVSSGDVFKILAGQKGLDATDTAEHSGGTGGGGSFVALFQNSTYTPKLVAGGGGGAASLHLTSHPTTYIGQDGQLTQNGGTDSQNPGGINGLGGTSEIHTGYHGGTGGGGFWGDGVNNSVGSPIYGTPSTPGKAFVNGGTGGIPGSHSRAGGFGGGGAAGFSGGGGGGYSGGGAGSWEQGSKDSGGGGGSYNDGVNQVNTAGVQTGNGKVVISW